jgi:hypothetical protein
MIVSILFLKLILGQYNSIVQHNLLLDVFLVHFHPLPIGKTYFPNVRLKQASYWYILNRSDDGVKSKVQNPSNP